MYCTKCGVDLQNSLTCPSCGTLGSFSPGRLPDGSGRRLYAFSTPLFAALCVLLSVMAFFSLFFFVSAAVFTLLAVAFWMLYYTAKNGRPISEAALSLADGTARAMLIIGWVKVGLCSITAIYTLILSSRPWVSNLAAILSTTYTGFTPFGFPLILISFGLLAYAFFSVFVTLFYTRNLKKYIHSVRLNIACSRFPIIKDDTVKPWLMALSIIEIIASVIIIGISVSQPPPPIAAFILFPALIQLLLKACIHITGYVLITRYLNFYYVKGLLL